MKASAILISAAILVSSAARSQDPVRLRTEAKQHRTAGLVCALGGIAMSLPLLLQDEANLQQAGMMFGTFAVGASVVVTFGAARRDDRARRAMLARR